MKNTFIFILLFLVYNISFSQNFTTNQLIGTWEGKQAKFNFHNDYTYKASRNNLVNVGHWRLQKGYSDDLPTKIILSYSGFDLDSKFQIVDLQDGNMKLKDLSDGNLYSFTKKKKKQRRYKSTVSSQEQSLLFWGTLGALIFLSNDSGSSKGSYKGTYSNDANTDRFLKNEHEQRTREQYRN